MHHRQLKKLRIFLGLLIIAFTFYAVKSLFTVTLMKSCKAKMTFESEYNNLTGLGLSNPHDFRLVQQPSITVCTSDLLMLAFVTISPHLFEHRVAIRNTWANIKRYPDMRVIFAVGLSKNTTINEQIRVENDQYGDILQEDFKDHYRNLTTKVMMAFKWISLACPHVKFVLRINDDVMVNTHHLLKYLKNIEYSQKDILHQSYMGYAIMMAPVDRVKSSKFYVSPEDYADAHFLPYHEGSAYLLTGDLCGTLLRASFLTRRTVLSTWLEDVYVGMLVYQIRAKMVNIVNFYAQINQWAAGEAIQSINRRNINETFFVYITSEPKVIYETGQLIDTKLRKARYIV